MPICYISCTLPAQTSQPPQQTLFARSLPLQFGEDQVPEKFTSGQEPIGVDEASGLVVGRAGEHGFEFWGAVEARGAGLAGRGVALGQTLAHERSAPSLGRGGIWAGNGALFEATARRTLERDELVAPHLNPKNQGRSAMVLQKGSHG